MARTDAELVLKIILRYIGSASLLALIFVAAPYAWMNDIHQWLGLGSLPAEPIVGYLARSTSALYAWLGGLFWVLSFDLRRNRSVLIYVGMAVAVFGVALTIVDTAEGLPLLWRFWEGPVVTVIGVSIFMLSRSIGVSPNADSQTAPSKR